MEEMNLAKPKWMKKGGIDEVEFCQEFQQIHDVICVNGTFFSREGRITDERILRKWIYDMISSYVSSNVSRRVDSLLSALRLDSSGMQLVDKELVLHVANGTLHLIQGFSPYKHYCRYRFKANYDPSLQYPKLWLQFLEDLLEPEDILTLQEYLGYCLIPTTVGQKMLIITGRGGEGKSRIGIVMRHLFGEALSVGSLSKVETNRFARADLEHLLVMVDDDLRLEALPDTNYIKSIITAETPMDLEKKGEQSYQGKLNVRFLAFGNDTLQALHDRSYGFFRRQIILTAKPIRPDREDDPLLAEQLKQEIDGIFLWCLEGLYRLLDHDFRFTISQKAMDNLSSSMRAGNNILQFMESDGYFCYDENEHVTSRYFYCLYKQWCEDNMLTPLSPKTFWGFLAQNREQYHLRTSNKVPIGQGRYARGFWGIRALLR